MGTRTVVGAARDEPVLHPRQFQLVSAFEHRGAAVGRPQQGDHTRVDQSPRRARRVRRGQHGAHSELSQAERRGRARLPACEIPSRDQEATAALTRQLGETGQMAAEHLAGERRQTAAEILQPRTGRNQVGALHDVAQHSEHFTSR